MTANKYYDLFINFVITQLQVLQLDIMIQEEGTTLIEVEM